MMKLAYTRAVKTVTADSASTGMNRESNHVFIVFYRGGRIINGSSRIISSGKIISGGRRVILVRRGRGRGGGGELFSILLVIDKIMF